MTDKQTQDLTKQNTEVNKTLFTSSKRIRIDPQCPNQNIDLDNLRSSLRKLLEETKVSSLGLPQKPVYLDSETKPLKAIKLLIENGIQSAPVLKKENNGMTLIGVLDLRDCIKYALDVYNRLQEQKKNSNNKDDEVESHMDYMARATFISTNQLSYIARMRKLVAVKEDASLFSLLKALSQGAHICAVLSKNGNELSTIVSQGTAFRCMYNQFIKVNKLGDTIRLESLFNKYITTKLITIKNNQTAYETFSLMANKNLSGLPVVDNSGKIVHNTSASDVKGWLGANKIINLQENIEDFLINIRKQNKSKNTSYPVSFCKKDESFSKAINKLFATRYHRVWIVDDNTKPIGVLALTDIFRWIVTE